MHAHSQVRSENVSDVRAAKILQFIMMERNCFDALYIDMELLVFTGALLVFQCDKLIDNASFVPFAPCHISAILILTMWSLIR